ncbi:SLC13 family permease [Arthrobacter sunyaminii]|uniref:SLC13 family permease n=1 Tax=Arthrobacter sunyaminii TaxID=2816859 RepID=UPI001A948F8F|nr:SLC13 family permease [Arthrobacter sunyaminii]MBO0898017.1 SLC13 family permease [Arthrobacter sunyaminii]
MSIELLSILVLAALFLIATVRPVHMGALALVAAFIMGTMVIGEDVDTVLLGFPADLFVILVGVTYLFALAKANGTIDWVVVKSVRMVGGRIALIPWVMFAITAVITSVGAVVPAAVAIIAPVAMGFAVRYKIRPVLMGLMVINGASAGGFSPISVFGSIVNGVVVRSDLPGSPGLLFLSSLLFNIGLGIVVFFMFGGRSFIGQRDIGDGVIRSTSRRTSPDDGAEPQSGGSGSRTSRAANTTVQTMTPSTGEPIPTESSLDRHKVFTLVGILVLAVAVLGFGFDVGFTAVTIAVILSLLSPESNKGAVSAIAWPTVLLLCGIVTYVSLMERIGTIDWLGNGVANIGAPLFAAILICFIGAIVSAFASTTGILGALIPLAVPFLMTGEVGAIGMIIALSISSSVVDSSPFSTSGALVVANSPEDQRDKVFRQLMVWGFSMVLIAPVATWLIFIVPGWS